jgi:hypothetical protein
MLPKLQYFRKWKKQICNNPWQKYSETILFSLRTFYIIFDTSGFYSVQKLNNLIYLQLEGSGMGKGDILNTQILKFIWIK